MAMANVHFAYDQWRQLGKEPPASLAPIWDEYTAMLADFPQDKLHQRVHAGHNCWVIPEEKRFVTGGLVEANCTVGTANELIRRIRALDSAGLDEIILLPAFEPRYRVLERVAQDVLSQL